MALFARYLLLLLVAIFLCTSVLAFKSTPPLIGINVLSPKTGAVFKRNEPITIKIETEEPKTPQIEQLYGELVLSYDLKPRPSQQIVVGVLHKQITSSDTFTYEFMTDKLSFGLDTGNYTIRK
ncbi:80_t:CDS:2 [Diversispora eburnea]|uniref:80_t:CDS:1 n=1 Tax=Diversispora eburnea TaxID=1213867 RepID=A0A9N8VQL9_9GLOM|nr:80_t:CDS:2 [Diversispora eburnea]